MIRAPLNGPGYVACELPFVTSFTSRPLAYIEKADGSGEVDWDWIVSRTMRDKKEWAAEDRERHKRALQAVKQEQQALADVVAIATDAPEVDDSEGADLEPTESADDES